MTDHARFDAFYRENLGRVTRACALVTLDPREAEDLAAESFARLWSRWGQIGSDDHAGGFVFKTAMRLCWKEARRRRRAVPVAIPDTDEGRGDAIEAATLRHDVTVALRDLPVRQRQAVVLRDWAGMETAVVANLLGMRESTVRVHLARARERLRAAMSDQVRGGTA
jgi:RNA polymerase sigma-70 factor, ECF subfamily